VAVLSFVGCSVFGKRSVVPDSVVTCRDLCRQGCAAVEQEAWHEAETLFRGAVQASPIDAEARRQLAEVFWSRGAAGAAIQEMETACGLAPHDSGLAVRAAAMRLAMGNHRQALAWAERSVTLDPKLAAAWAIRGKAHLATGKLELALADLHRSLGFAAGDAEVLQTIATIHLQAGRPQRCLETAQRLLDQFPPGEEPQPVLFLEGQALAALGRNRDAATSLTAAATRGPPRADIFCTLAKVEKRRGRAGAAAAAARQALAVDKRHASAIALLAELRPEATR
jgi:tetratricopeptide (TPR) repeat protein